MTKEEKKIWQTKGKTYRDNFESNVQVRRVLRKIKKEETLTNKQKFLSTYVDYLSQIEIDRMRLQRFPIFLSSHHLSLEKRGISRVSQFIYHIENYLAAIYMLEQRIRSLFNFIKKHTDRGSSPKADVDFLKTTHDLLISDLKHLVALRGKHTHVRSFEDTEIDQMEMFDKASDFSTDPSQKKQFKIYATILLRFQRNKWKNDIRRTIEKCDVQIGMLFSAYDKIIWQIHKKIR